MDEKKEKNKFNKFVKVIEFFAVMCIVGLIAALYGNISMQYYTDKNQELVSWFFSIIGYLFIVTGIFFLLCISANRGINMFPTLSTILVLAYIIGINFVFKERLIQHHVANEYYNWSLAFTMLFTIQISLLIYITYKQITKTLAGISYNDTYKSRIYIIYLLSLFSIITIGIMNQILALFSTDG